MTRVHPCKGGCGTLTPKLYCEACRVPRVGVGRRNPATIGRVPRPDSDDPGSAAAHRVGGQVGQRSNPQFKPVASGGVVKAMGARSNSRGAATPSGAATTKHVPRLEGLDSLNLTLYGAPRTKKTHNRLVKHKGRHKVLPSIQWTRWRDELKASGQVTAAMRLRDQPYNCAALFYRDADRGDAVGMYQGLADVLEYLGVVSNDKWIVSWDGSRMLVDRKNARLEITLTPTRHTNQ